MPIFRRSHDPFGLLSPAIDVPLLTGGPAGEAPVPPLGPLVLGGVRLPPGRPASSPSLWLTDDVVPDAVRAWRRLVDQYPSTGLWPLLLTPLSGEVARPWDSGELYPVDLATVDAVDVEGLLGERWTDSVVPIGGPTVHPAIERALAPFGAEFPGRAPSLPSTAEPAVVAAASVAAPNTRIGLVRCPRPADAVAAIGWCGAINRLQSEEVSAVLRSWEDRFGVVVAGLAFATVTLLVPNPPRDESHALSLAAEIAAFCPDALWQGSDGAWLGSDDTLTGLAHMLLHRPVWRLWWD
ncbi:DUF4253 domain-containing protein [Modestobacter sp. SSW1-42]|uniref:DUF4253 domain-containing protein n=1 Tax=Modestobacter sp. SSW1-42 TaxID=596372 RepID=UPI003986D606